MEDFIENNSFDERISYIGWVDHSNLEKHLNRLKLLVIPSYTETGPQIILEAIACGTPVLTTSVGLVPNIIEDGKTGFIIKRGSINSISHCVLKSVK